MFNALAVIRDVNVTQFFNIYRLLTRTTGVSNPYRDPRLRASASEYEWKTAFAFGVTQYLCFVSPTLLSVNPPVSL